MIGPRLTALTALAWVVTAAAVHAAPYCVQTQAISPQCVYDDPNECRIRAGQMGGQCVANPQTQVTSALGQYCLVVPGGRPSCNYVDPSVCQRDAVQQHGACIMSSEQTGRNLAPNPYRQVTPLPAG